MAGDPADHVCQDIEHGKAEGKKQDRGVYHWRISVGYAAEDEIPQAGDGENLLDHDGTG